MHYSDTIAGRVFTQQTSPLGLALPLYTTTVAGTTGICGMPIWNPPSSNRNVELLEVSVAYASGTAGSGGVVIMGVPLTALGAAGPVTALLTTTPINQLLGGGSASKVLSSNSNAASNLTMTAAGTTLPPSSTAAGPVRTLAGINAETTGTPAGTIIASYDFKGSLVVAPGYFIYLACTVATTALYVSSVTWKENVIVAGQG